MFFGSLSIFYLKLLFLFYDHTKNSRFSVLNTKSVLCCVSVLSGYHRIRIHFWRVDNTISIQIILCIPQKNTRKVWHCIIPTQPTASSNVKAKNNTISQQQFYMKHLKCKFITLCCLSAYYSFGDRQCLVFFAITMNENAKKKEEEKIKNEKQKETFILSILFVN